MLLSSLGRAPLQVLRNSSSPLLVTRLSTSFYVLYSLLYASFSPLGRFSVLRGVLRSYWTFYRPCGPFSVFFMLPVVNRFFIAIFASLAALLRPFNLPHVFYSTVEL